jgi:hypothetical protein
MGCSRPVSLTEDLDTVYRQYCEAVVRRDGTQAVALVSAGTRRRYQEFAEAAMTADEQSLAALPLTARLQVLLLRQRMDAGSLAAVQGRGLLAHIIEQGWLESAGFMDTQLARAAADGDRAQAQLHRGGQPTRERAYFLREDGAWRINLLPNLTSADRKIEAAVETSGLNEKAYLESLVAQATKQPLRGDLWQPMK